MQRGLLGTARPAFTCSRRTCYNVMRHNTLQRRAPPNTNLALLEKKHNTEQSTQIRISLLTSPAMETWGSRVSKSDDVHLSVTDDVADTFGPPLVHTAKWHNICSCVSQTQRAQHAQHIGRDACTSGCHDSTSDVSRSAEAADTLWSATLAARRSCQSPRCGSLSERNRALCAPHLARPTCGCGFVASAVSGGGGRRSASLHAWCRGWRCRSRGSGRRAA